MTWDLESDVIEAGTVGVRLRRIRPNVLQSNLVVKIATTQKSVMITDLLNQLQVEEASVEVHCSLEVADF